VKQNRILIPAVANPFSRFDGFNIIRIFRNNYDMGSLLYICRMIKDMGVIGNSLANCLSFPVNWACPGIEKSVFVVVLMCCILGVQHKFPTLE
jgi:hypothetical protein